MTHRFDERRRRREEKRGEVKNCEKNRVKMSIMGEETLLVISCHQQEIRRGKERRKDEKDGECERSPEGKSERRKRDQKN